MSTPACLAPGSALYLRPDGYVLACCASAHVLGRVSGPRRESLADIWHGSRGEMLRSAVAVGDLSVGCDECEAANNGGSREATIMASYDHLAPHVPDRRYPTSIDFALSNTCNLQCVMCNGDLSSAIRGRREGRLPLASAYDDRFFAELREFLPYLQHASFKGGEPFLGRETRRVWDDMIKLGVACETTVVTNGTQMSVDVKRYVRQLRMNVKVSIDAISAEVNEGIRLGTDQEVVRANIDQFHQLTDELGTDLSLSFCLMPQNWHELGAVLEQGARLGVSVDIIWVNHPPRFDILELPRVELQAILVGLERQEGGGRERMGMLADRWDDVVQRVRSQLERRDQTRPPGNPLGPTGDDLAVELRTWAGVDPVLVRCRGDVIEAVDTAPWAAWMGAEGWPGSTRSDLLPMLWEATGSSASYESVERGDGVHQVTVQLSGGDWAGELRVLLHEDALGQIVALAPAPSTGVRLRGSAEHR